MAVRRREPGVDWLMSALGAVLVLVVLADVFQTLWNPSGQGRLTGAVLTGVWRTSRRLGGRARLVAGPLGMLAVIGSWAALVVIGAALVYGPHLPDGFSYSPGLDPAERSGVVDALYLSLVTATTLGFGDVVPTIPWLRLVMPIQALVGFALLTAAVTWVLQVYPALVRRRTTSLRLAALRRADALEALSGLSATTAARILDDVTAGIAQARVDLTQYTETYYFLERSPDTTLALTVGYAHDLAVAGKASPEADVRLSAGALSWTLDDLAGVLDSQFLGVGGGTAAVLGAYAAENRIGNGDGEGRA